MLESIAWAVIGVCQEVRLLDKMDVLTEKALAYMHRSVHPHLHPWAFSASNDINCSIQNKCSISTSSVYAINGTEHGFSHSEVISKVPLRIVQPFPP